MTNSNDDPIVSLFNELHIAEVALETLRTEHSTISNKVCDAVNRVNTLQKKLDVYIKERRSKSPHSTDWRTHERIAATTA